MASTSIIAKSEQPGESVAPSRLARFEAWLERVGERLNPILVKECRQALKGRQFSITFALVLFCCWGWSVYGVMRYGTSLRFGGGGAGLELFYGYFCILSFALVLIVPYGAFRSLADERDDRTFELVAITTLRPRQIVGGKLGSAVVQMMIYVSAVTPCLGFTYLLRGVEAPLILFVLAAIVLLSLGLSTLALLASTLTRERIWQTLMSAAVVIGLFLVYYGTLGLSYEAILVGRAMSFDQAEFWYACFALVMIYGSYLLLVFLAAAAQLTFASENRSTALRIVMVGQQLLLTFLFAWAATLSPASSIRENFATMLVEMAPVYVILLTIHWAVMGMFLTTEAPELSNRAKRRLPQSVWGRALFTWFCPGSATGYVFTLANLAAALVLATGACYAAESRSPAFPTARQIREFYWAAPLLFGYVAFYLGLGRALLGLLRRISKVGVISGVLLQICLFVVGCIAPLVIQSALEMRIYSYSLLYVSNPFMTLEQIDRSFTSMDIGTVATLVLVAAGFVFVANLPAVAAELRRVRAPKPQRVLDDDVANKAKPAPVGPRNPWE